MRLIASHVQAGPLLATMIVGCLLRGGFDEWIDRIADQTLHAFTLQICATARKMHGKAKSRGPAFCFVCQVCLCKKMSLVKRALIWK